MTVILKPQCGSRRWQHIPTSPRATCVDPSESNYTIILGSHRNSRLKIEKDGELCHLASGIPGSKLNVTDFNKYWINLDGQSITIGYGDPISGNVCCRWMDALPIKNIRFIGLSAWDKHVAYRNVCLQPSINFGSKFQGKEEDRFSRGGRKMLLVPTLVNICSDALMEEISASTSCAIINIADTIRPIADDLRARALDFAIRHFAEAVVADPSGFEGLCSATFAEILESQWLNACEKFVFDSFVQWSTGKALKEMDLLLPLIRFPQMSPADLEDVSRHPLMQESLVLRDLVEEAVEANTLDSTTCPTIGCATIRASGLVREPTPMEIAAATRFRQRHTRGSTELMYMYDGDHNGLFWYLGTRHGSQSWMNPAILGIIHARASSPVARGTDNRAVVGRTFMRTNFAGPRRDPNGELVAWWQIDLGSDASLICNYYTLRQDGSTEFLRTWALQGSEDGATWVDLRKHINDTTLKLPGQYASWPVGGPYSSVPYRYFRIFLSVTESEKIVNKQGLVRKDSNLSPSRCKQSPREAMAIDTKVERICLSNIELYGSLIYR